MSKTNEQIQSENEARKRASNADKLVDPKSLSTTVTLSIKSGPDNGELVGDTERQTDGGLVSFSGLQFTEAGEYTIVATPDNEDIDPVEFNISVEPEEEFIEQEGDDVEESPDGTRPIIAQIDKTRINLPPMEFDSASKRGNSEEADDTLISSGIGFVPFVWYNGISIRTEHIKILDIFYQKDGLLPKCILSFGDTTGLIEDNPPTNNTTFEIFLNSGSDNIKSIHLRFRIVDYKKKRTGVHSFTGILDIPNFYDGGKRYQTYIGTSFNVLRTISKELLLGFNSNINKTNDSMKWKRNGEDLQNFIMDNIVKHSYISDDTFMNAYIDFYYCLNYVDVEKEWNRNIQDDVTMTTQGVTNLNESSKDDDKIVKLRLTNDPTFNEINTYFKNDFKLLNNSTKKSNKSGHYTIIKVYDRNKRQMLIFNVEPITSEDGDTKVILKGSKLDNNEQKSNFSTINLGTMDLDNVHEQYLYAMVQNERNYDNLTNIKAEITLPNPNYMLYKYQKVQVDFNNLKQTPSDPEPTDERLSGEWIILDIRFTWIRGALNQKLIIARKELSKKRSEIDNEEPAPKREVDNSEINENPVDEIEEPNAEYNEGDVITVLNENGEEFIMEILQIDENGEDIVANIIQNDN